MYCAVSRCCRGRSRQTAPGPGPAARMRAGLDFAPRARPTRAHRDRSKVAGFGDPAGLSSQSARMARYSHSLPTSFPPFLSESLGLLSQAVSVSVSLSLSLSVCLSLSLPLYLSIFLSLSVTLTDLCALSLFRFVSPLYHSYLLMPARVNLLLSRVLYSIEWSF